MTVPSTSTGTLYGYGGVTNVTITSSATTYVPFNFNCKLDAHVTMDILLSRLVGMEILVVVKAITD